MTARRRSTPSPLTAYRRALSQWTRLATANVKAGQKAAGKALVRQTAKGRPSRSDAAWLAGGTWIAGLAVGPGGARRYRLYRPPGIAAAERRPLLVMLHGCGQDAQGFALSTRMNRLAARESCFVLYPEQDRSAHPHGCWQWYATRQGQAQREAATLVAAIDQVCLLYPADPLRVAIAGLSAGAGMAALLATREPARFCALVMHSGVGPGVADTTAAALKAMRGRAAPAVPSVQSVQGEQGAQSTTAMRGAIGNQAAQRTPWPPLLVIQGNADPVVAAVNATAVVQRWADRAGATAGEPRQVRRGRRRPMTVTDHKVGRRTVARLCRIEGLGHAWSGGDARWPYGDPLGPDASRLAWAFIAMQFRTPA